MDTPKSILAKFLCLGAPASSRLLTISFFAILCISSAASAQSTGTGGTSTGGSTTGETGAQGVYSSRGGSPWATYYRYLEENPEIYAMADKTFPEGETGYGHNGETKKRVDGPRIPGKIWPIVTQPHIPQGPEKMMNWAKTMDRITGYSKEPIGSVNLSPAFAALSMGVAGQMLADELQSPQATMPRAREEQNQQIQLSADNTAAMERQQAGCAIDFVASYLYNFTVEEGNKWNQVRNQLFLPMALLLLLPGAVLAQVKSVASQGFSVLGEINPFDGIMRSIVAIFLIPATYLVVNYGIDAANSITKVVSEQYKQIFGTDMYEDAMCAHIRAFPFREPIENKNFVPNEEAKMGRLSPNNTPFAELEGRMINIKLTDPCAKLNIVPADRANEQVKYSVNAQRNAYNTANAALAMAWNILCAFQMAYLYYLWFVGPVVAALWVYPMKQLRDAFPSWCEGVVTLCFWSLFWNTVVLLMACFRGVDETGTVIMTALNFLATACVKFAFDFAGLVKDAGREAGRMAEKMAHSASGAKGGPNAAPAHQTQQGLASHNPSGVSHGSGLGHSPHGPSGVGSGSALGGRSPELLAAGAEGGPSAFGLAEAADGVAGSAATPFGTANSGASGAIGHVSMHDFPHPPLHGSHSNALGVVGTSLGGAALWAGLAALAQPHFQHNNPAGQQHPQQPGTGNAATGATSFGGTDIISDPTPIASNPGSVVHEGDLHEGDLYEHNWGDIAASVASAGGLTNLPPLDPNAPPLANPPAMPAISLTPLDGPNLPNLPTLPPSSITDIAIGGPNVNHNAAHIANAEHHSHGGAISPQLADTQQPNSLFKDMTSSNAFTAQVQHQNYDYSYTPPAQQQQIQQQQQDQQQQQQQLQQQLQQQMQQQQLQEWQQQQQSAQQTAQQFQQQMQQDQVQQLAQQLQQQQQQSQQDQVPQLAQQLQQQMQHDHVQNFAQQLQQDQSTQYQFQQTSDVSYSASSQQQNTDYYSYPPQVDQQTSISSYSAPVQQQSTSYSYASAADVEQSVDTSYTAALQQEIAGSAFPTPITQYQPQQQPDAGIALSTTYSAHSNYLSQDVSTYSSVNDVSAYSSVNDVSAYSAVSHVASTTNQALPDNSLPDVAIGAASASIAAGSAASASTSAEAYAKPSSPPPSNAQQQLRNQLAYPDDGSRKQAPVNVPKQAKAKPLAKPSSLNTAVGKAGSPAPLNNSLPPRTNQLSKPIETPKAPTSSSYAKASLQQDVEALNTRNRYVQASQMSQEELAELEAKARASGEWLE